MKGTKPIQTTLLFLGLSVFGLAAASSSPSLPPEVVQTVQSGSVVVFLDASGNPIWSSDLGTKPEEARIRAAASIAIYDAEGNRIAAYPLTRIGDKVLVELPDGTLVPAGPIARLAFKAAQEEEAYEYAERHPEEHQYREKEEHEEKHAYKEKHEDKKERQAREDKKEHHEKDD